MIDVRSPTNRHCLNEHHSWAASVFLLKKVQIVSILLQEYCDESLFFCIFVL